MVSVENNSILKKISAVIVMITALVFFSFNVFADTPVQPLQVVTYSNTTTNVRISGTAERLHYNVESFQVVFMNPPNNYGTACTPVLVSFRFYNSSDLPAYVGQAEFELTATTGTGAVNTIIYGYDQISTDLFVAESSYSTAEVGRIGIGASNDFAYYTGFVIPPRTSLYFSCIVYVNASAYGQNNTGATEDVNQVTLSALNLYSNQISFSADYPYHNQPIDFSSIIDAISDLSDTVSTSNELQSIISTLTSYSQHISSDVISDTYAISTTFTTLLLDNTNNVNIRAYASIFGYTVEYHEYVDQLSGDTTRYALYDIPINFKYRIINGSNKAFRYYNWYNDITWTMNEPSLTNAGFYVEVQPHDHLEFLNFTRNGYRVEEYLRHNLYYGLILPNEFTEVEFTYHYLYLDYDHSNNINGNNVAITNFVFNSGLYNSFTAVEVTGYENYNYNEHIQQGMISNTLKNLLDAYSSVNGLDDFSNNSDDVADVSDSNHIIEESYYSANASAIEATGLSNYRFSNEQNNGIGKVADDFMLLWNALGSWNGVYIFSLTMALATFIMRHGGLFTIKRETSDKGGEGD